MSQEPIAPVRHGIISGTATTSVEAARSGVRGLWKGTLYGIAAPIVAGAVLFGILGVAGGLLLAAGSAAIGIGAAFTGLLYGAGAGAAVGALFSVAGAKLGLGLGTLFGLAKGASRGVSRVSQERGASEMLRAQVDIYRAQSQPQTVIHAPSATNQNSFPGATMNRAGNGAQLSAIEHQGLVANPQLAAAR